MGDQKRKADRAMISVLIPERGRPAMLARLIDSLCATADGDQRFEILVAVDDDDPAWVDQPPHEPWSLARPVMWYHGPRPKTLGEKINMLARQAQGSILWFVANDYVIDTHGWPTRFREAVAKLPNGIGYPFPRDDLHPDHAAFPIITRKMVDAIGFMFPPWFGGGWWVDTWADECGILLGVRPEINVTVRAPEGRGKSHGLRDISFWAEFFRAMAPFRSRDALGLAKLAYGESSAAYADVQARLPEREAICELRTRHLVTPEFAKAWEGNAESPPGPAYAEVKAYAEGMLKNIRAARPKRVRVALAVPSGRTVEATTYNCLAALSAHSAMAGVDLAFLNVQSSQITHGRNTTVKLALQEGCDYIFWCDADMKFPPDALLRLLSHDKDIVGATYNKRVKPYVTLGKLIGPHPDRLDDGLHEASQLPGGLLLVKTSVYRDLVWPWYAETYRWSGETGWDAFENMLLDYFSERPPQSIIDDLATTPFGHWIKDNYVVGNGEYPMYSEDLFFITKARRSGFRAWCDLRLTNETSHLGEIEVTCKLPEGTIRLPEAAD